jgi:hypothetical protein
MRIRRWLLISNVVLWVIAGGSMGYAGYVRWIAIPRDQAIIQAIGHEKPCTQGMTLMPGESCRIEFAVPIPKPTRDDL